MKQIIYSSIAFMLLLMAGACSEEESHLFDDKDTFFAFNIDKDKILESETEPLMVPVYVASSSPSGQVNFVVDIEGINNPAIEGVDFEIVNTTQSLNFTDELTEYISILPLDNDVMDGSKTFRLKLISEGASYNVGMTDGAGTVAEITIGDDEHPLIDFFGTFDLYETTIEPLVYEYTVELSGHEDADKAVLTGLWADGQDLVLQFNYDEGTVKIMRDQQLFNVYIGASPYNLAVLGWEWADQSAGIVNLYPEVFGTFDLETGVIEFPNGYALQVTAPAESAGALWAGGLQDYCKMTKQAE
ncbi:hypothetical protein [Carboxylicivirga sp. M1479]|uniref:hypothetical protein n=1 Tax=Carboxylicivirga sp. M1479 TaxID=2594476 RepID=UPI0011779A90|nr:hypothetical protein [Carboxylicivirga sp. M1479]TRX63323.1 hypothetical protein FNN09_18910 [Carboxylicivirga sp. M1479]